jgi:hypothetical protein
MARRVAALQRAPYAVGNPVIRVYDDTGNVIDTHEHAGGFKEW